MFTATTIPALRTFLLTRMSLSWLNNIAIIVLATAYISSTVQIFNNSSITISERSVALSPYMVSPISTSDSSMAVANVVNVCDTMGTPTAKANVSGILSKTTDDTTDNARYQTIAKDTG